MNGFQIDFLFQSDPAEIFPIEATTTVFPYSLMLLKVNDQEWKENLFSDSL